MGPWLGTTHDWGEARKRVNSECESTENYSRHSARPTSKMRRRWPSFSKTMTMPEHFSNLNQATSCETNAWRSRVAPTGRQSSGAPIRGVVHSQSSHGTLATANKVTKLAGCCSVLCNASPRHVIMSGQYIMSAWL